MTTVIPVSSATGTYDVVIGPRLLDECGDALRERGVATDVGVFIVTDEHVDKLGYADQVARSCRNAGFSVARTTVPAGDASKSLSEATQLYNALLDAKVRRNGIILAVGGGMVGDLAGFVAATYQRGIRFVQIPTTLLAHDSSIGGKVGVNLPRGKNLVGAFHPPAAVLYDILALKTLPEVEWQGGMAEMIKHGLIGDQSLFDSLCESALVRYPTEDVLEHILAKACSVKIRIVEADERESGQRMLLNLGHTVGHAVELVSHYALNHGYAVAIGMSVEAEIAVLRGWLPETTRDVIRRTLRAHGLPTAPPDYNLDEILAVLGRDKKHGSTGWTFALPKAVGRVEIARDVTREEVVQAWQRTTSHGRE